PASPVDCTVDPTNQACTQYVSVVDLAPGFYTVEVQENISGQNCKVMEVIEIKPTALPPVISLDNIIANTACDLPAAADGAIAINVAQDAADPNTPTYDITMSPDPHGFSVTGAIAGNYLANQLAP